MSDVRSLFFCAWAPEPPHIPLADVEVPRACIEGARPSEPCHRRLSVALRARDVLVDAPLRPQLGRALPPLLWNDGLEANMQAIAAAMPELTLRARAGLGWLGAGAALLGIAALGAAALQGAQAGALDLQTAQRPAALVCAAVGAGLVVHRLRQQRDDAARLLGLAHFAEDLVAVRAGLAETTVEQGTQQLLHAAKTADAVGGAAIVLLHECLNDLDSVAQAPYTTLVAEYHSRRLLQVAEPLVSFGG